VKLSPNFLKNKTNFLLKGFVEKRNDETNRRISIEPENDLRQSPSTVNTPKTKRNYYEKKGIRYSYRIDSSYTYMRAGYYPKPKRKKEKRNKWKTEKPTRG
jgi:hypothetical protein